MTAWSWALGSVIVVSLMSLVGAVTVSVGQERLQRRVTVMVGLAVGAMFGDAFIHLLPRAVEQSGERVTSLMTLVGIFGFFVLEKFLYWRHVHVVSAPAAVAPLGYLNLVADGLHNWIDGVLIGAAYLVSVPIGLATTLAVVFHEIPQEIGDFGVLLQAGFSRRRALLFNFLSGSLAILGTIMALVVGSALEFVAMLMLPLAAGSFTYIAGSDLVPELQKERDPAASAVQLAAMGAGVGVMFLLTLWE